MNTKQLLLIINIVALIALTIGCKTKAEEKIVKPVKVTAVETHTGANVQLVTYKYRLDAVLLKDVLQAQTVLANSDYDYQKALLAFWTAKADFEKAIGEDK